jgi:hypothetical protein
MNPKESERPEAHHLSRGRRLEPIRPEAHLCGVESRDVCGEKQSLEERGILLVDNEHSSATFWSHPRTVPLALLTLGVIVAVAPLTLIRDEAWVVIWVDTTFTLIAVATALKCLATARHQHGQERIAWHFIGFAYLSYAAAQFLWSFYELVLDTPTPIPSLADVGFLAAPLFLMVGIWFYREKAPTLSSAIVQLGNAGILIAAFFLADTIIYRQLLEELNSPERSTMITAYAVIAMTAFVFALFNIFFHMHGPKRVVMMPLLLALGALAASDVHGCK